MHSTWNYLTGAGTDPEQPRSNPGATLKQPRSTPGAPPERSTRPTRHRRPQNAAPGPQKAHSGGLRDLIFEAFRACFWRSAARPFWCDACHNSIKSSICKMTVSKIGGGGDTPHGVLNISAAPWQACRMFHRFCRLLLCRSAPPLTCHLQIGPRI